MFVAVLSSMLPMDHDLLSTKLQKIPAVTVGVVNLQYDTPVIPSKVSHL